MKKIKNFSDFINESLYDLDFLGKLGSILSNKNNYIQKNPSPSSNISASSSKGLSNLEVSKDILNSEKYLSYGTDPLKIAKDFETVATGPYKWVSGSTGMPVDIYFKSSSALFKKPSDLSTYCTGFTFAVGFIASLNRGLLNSFSDSDIKKMQVIWNSGDPKAKPKLCVDAISKPISSGLKALGKEVTINEAKAGDFCQIWRTTGSGHSVIVMEIIEKDGKKIGIKYYSSNGTVNKKTKRTGPGENTEYFSDSGGNVIRNNTYYARLEGSTQS